MCYNIELSDKCEELLFDDYDELCERGKPNTPVENEMLRHSLEVAVEEGWVKSFSKKEFMTLEA